MIRMKGERTNRMERMEAAATAAVFFFPLLHTEHSIVAVDFACVVVAAVVVSSSSGGGVFVAVNG